MSVRFLLFCLYKILFIGKIKASHCIVLLFCPFGGRISPGAHRGIKFTWKLSFVFLFGMSEMRIFKKNFYFFLFYIVRTLSGKFLYDKNGDVALSMDLTYVDAINSLKKYLLNYGKNFGTPLQNRWVSICTLSCPELDVNHGFMPVVIY